MAEAVREQGGRIVRRGDMPTSKQAAAQLRAHLHRLQLQQLRLLPSPRDAASHLAMEAAKEAASHLGCMRPTSRAPLYRRRSPTSHEALAPSSEREVRDHPEATGREDGAPSLLLASPSPPGMDSGLQSRVPTLPSVGPRGRGRSTARRVRLAVATEEGVALPSVPQMVSTLSARSCSHRHATEPSTSLAHGSHRPSGTELQLAPWGAPTISPLPPAAPCARMTASPPSQADSQKQRQQRHATLAAEAYADSRRLSSLSLSPRAPLGLMPRRDGMRTRERRQHPSPPAPTRIWHFLDP